MTPPEDWYNMASPPDEFPPLAHGDGSWGWDSSREKVTLRHRIDGHTYIERAGTPEECLVKRDRRRTATGGPAVNRVEAVLDSWREYAAIGKSQSTATSYRTSAKHFCEAFGRSTPFAAVTVEAVEAMWAALVARGNFGQGSLEKRSSHWNLVLAFAVRRGQISDEQYVLLSRARLPKLAPVPPPPANWHTAENYQKVRAHLAENPTPRNVLYLTMLLAGLRPGEAMGLKREYLDLGAGTLRVEGAIVRDLRRPLLPDEESHAFAGGTMVWSPRLKTDHLHRKAHRTIPLAADLQAALAALPAFGSFVFAEPEGLFSSRVGEDHAHRVAQDVLVPYVTPNGYRHTFASVCRAHHMPYETLAALMGHKDATQIIRVYGHPLKTVSPVDLDRYLEPPGA